MKNRICKRWTPEEDEYLFAHYETTEVWTIAQHLSRSTQAIMCRAQQFNLRQDLPLVNKLRMERLTADPEWNEKRGRTKNLWSCTKCEICRNAVPTADGQYGCSWSREFVPVKGWKAQATMATSASPYTSYRVIECPEFVPDEPRKAPKKGWDESDDQAGNDFT